MVRILPYFLITLVLIPPLCYSQNLELVIPIGHSRRVTSVSFTPDSRYALSGSWDNTLKLWEVATGKLIRSFVGHSDNVTSVSISPNGKYVLSGSFDHTSIIWEVATGRMIRSFEGHSDIIFSVSFSPDGKYVLSGSGDKTLKLWDVSTGKMIRSFEGHSDLVSSVSFSPDGRNAISGGADKTLKLWDIATGRMIRSFEGHSDDILSVSFSPDGKYVLSGSDDATLKLWDVSTGKVIRTFVGHSEEIYSVSFNPDGRFALSGSWDKTLKLWDVATGKSIWSIEASSAVVISVSFSPDGRYVLSGSSAFRDNKPLKLWDTATGKLIRSFKGRSRIVSSVDFSPERRYALSGGGDGILKLWDFVTGKMIRSFEGHHYIVSSAQFSPDGKYVLSGGLNDLSNLDNSVKLWDVVTGKMIRSFKGHSNWVYSVTFSPDGRYALSGSWDHTLKLWDITTGRMIRSFEGHSDAIRSVSFSPNGKYAVSGGADKTLKLWDVETGKIIRSFEGHSGTVSSVSFSPDGRYVLSGSFLSGSSAFREDKTLKLWDVSTDKMIHSFEGHSNWVSSVTFSPKGKYVLSGGGDKTLKLWDVSTGKMIRSFEGHSNYVNAVSFSPDGKYVLSGSDDATLKLWDVSSEEELITLVSLPNGDEWIVTTPDGLFDASPGAMKEMYFVQGLDIIDLEQLKDRYYEPGLLAKVMGYSKEPLRKSRGLNNIELYPDIELIHPTENKGKLGIKLTNRGGGLGKVLIWINGKEVTTDARGKNVDPDDNEITISYDITNHPYLKSGEVNEIEVKAYNKEEYLVSSGKTLYFIDNRDKEDYEPSLYAIIIGASNYNGDELDLKYAAKDAEDFANALELTANQYLDKVDIKLLSTENADFSKWPTKLNIEWAFAEVGTKAKPSDVLVVYLAGHGVNYGGSEGDFYFLTSEASTGKLTDPVVREQVAISSDELTELIKTIPALKQVLILDACHSGQVAEDLMASRTGRPSSEIRALERMKDRTGMYVLAGSAADAVSYETSIYGQGLLTYSLLFGMKGAALRENKYVDIMQLFQFAADKVPELAENIGGIQKPEIRVPYGAQSFDIGIATEEVKNQIILPSPKPMFLRSSFENEITFNDDLRLSDAIDDEFINIQSRDGNEVIFIDASRFSGAYSLKGRYQKDGDVYKVKVRLFKGDEPIVDFEVSGKEVKELTGLIINNALQQIK